MTPNQTQGIGHQKYHTHVHCRTTSPKFLSVSLYNHFQDIAHFRIFPLSPMLKFQSATKIFNFWQIAKTFITLHSLMTALYIMKFGSDQIKPVGGAFPFKVP